MTEYVVVTIIMISGGFLWAYIIGGCVAADTAMMSGPCERVRRICGLVATMDVDKKQFQQDFDRTNAMLRDLGLPRYWLCHYMCVVRQFYAHHLDRT
jgi:hypothetical protein